MTRIKKIEDAETKRLDEFDRLVAVVEQEEPPELLDLLRAHLALQAQLASFEGRILTDRDRDRASRDTLRGWVARSADALRAQLDPRRYRQSPNEARIVAAVEQIATAGPKPSDGLIGLIAAARAVGASLVEGRDRERRREPAMVTTQAVADLLEAIVADRSATQIQRMDDRDRLQEYEEAFAGGARLFDAIARHRIRR